MEKMQYDGRRVIACHYMRKNVTVDFDIVYNAAVRD